MDKKATKATFAQLMCNHRATRNGYRASVCLAVRVIGYWLSEELDKVDRLLTDN